MENIDPEVKNLVSAIGRAETGDSSPEAYSKKGASGEFGRYQFMPDTYKAYAKKYIGDENAQPTVENQNKIAYSFVKEKKDSGFNPAQIASMWNAGEGKPNAYKENFKGINSAGVAYDTPAYAQKVSDYYNQSKAQAPRQTFTESVPEQAPTKTGVDKAAGILRSVSAGGKIGEGIGTLIARAKTKKGNDIVTADYDKLTPEARARLEAKGVPVSRESQLEETAKNIKGPSAGQIAGDVAKAGLQVATAAGIGKGVKAIKGLAKGANVLESKAVVNNLKRIGLKNPTADFNAFNNAEKVEMLTQTLKGAGRTDRMVIQQALDKLIPVAIKEAGGKVAFSQAYPKLATLLKIGKGVAKQAIAGTIIGSAINKGDKIAGLLR